MRGRAWLGRCPARGACTTLATTKAWVGRPCASPKTAPNVARRKTASPSGKPIPCDVSLVGENGVVPLVKFKQAGRDPTPDQSRASLSSARCEPGVSLIFRLPYFGKRKNNYMSARVATVRQRITRLRGTSPEGIAAMTGVPDKAVESVRSDWVATCILRGNRDTCWIHAEYMRDRL